MATYGTTSLIPKMTSATAPSGVASVSSYHSTSNVYFAFDGNVTTASAAWVTNGTTSGWVDYTFPFEVIVGKYTIYPQSSYLTRAPKSWTLQGSNDDGDTWDIIDTQVNITGWVNSTGKEFIIPPKKYRKFRMNVTANSGDATYLSINEFQLFEYIPDKRFFIQDEIGDKFTASFSDPSLNVVPLMTSDNTPSGRVIYSAFQGYPNYAYAAFNYTTATGWLGAVNNPTNQWVGYIFDSPKIVGKYTVYPHPGSLDYAPSIFRFEASNDGVDWTILDRKERVSDWMIGASKTFTISNVDPYTHYRIYVERNTNGNRYIGIGELQMYETYATLISLTRTPNENDFLTKGLQSGRELILDEPFSTKVKFILNERESFGSGKIYRKKINTDRFTVRKVKSES